MQTLLIPCYSLVPFRMLIGIPARDGGVFSVLWIVIIESETSRASQTVVALYG